MNQNDFLPTLIAYANRVANDRHARAFCIDMISKCMMPLLGLPVEILEQMVDAEEACGPEKIDKELSQWQLDEIAELGLSTEEAIAGANKQRELILDSIRVLIQAKHAGYMMDLDLP